MNSETAGYEREHVAEFYDYVHPYKTREDVPFYVKEARKHGKGGILEIGCGTGRLTLPIALSGKDITGLDLSTAMLDVFRRNLEKEAAEVQERITLVQADMTDFDLGREFSLIVIPFRTFLHIIRTDDQIACLDCVYRHLKAGGKFILDIFNPALPILVDPQYMEEWGREPEFTMPDGRVVVRTSRLSKRDWHAQVNHCELIYNVKHPDGKKERIVHEFPMRYIFRYEAEHLLERCGFHLETIYCDYNYSPYGSAYPGELVCVANKPE